jgi:hypothetical protein
MTQENMGVRIVTQLAQVYRDTFLRREEVYLSSSKRGYIANVYDMHKLPCYNADFEYQRLSIVMDSLFDSYCALIDVYPDAKETWNRVNADIYEKALDQAVRNAKAS